MSNTFKFNNKILNYLNDQRKSGKFCDVIIKLHNEFSIRAHFCVVAPQSSFIGGDQFLQESCNFSIQNPLTIEILNFECNECLEVMFEFFYSNDISIMLEHKLHMKTLANMLGATDMSHILKNICDDDDHENENINNIHDDGKDITPTAVENRILNPKQRHFKLSYA